MKKALAGGAKPIVTPDLTKNIDPQMQQQVQAAVRQLMVMGLNEEDIATIILEMMGEAGHEVDEKQVKKIVQGV